MLIHATVDSEGEFVRWKEAKKRIDGDQVREFLFLSEEEEFEDGASCGMGGVPTAKVGKDVFRCFSKESTV